MKCEYCGISIKINWGNANRILCEYCANTDESQSFENDSNISKENTYHLKTVVDAGDRFYEYFVGIIVLIVVGLLIANLVGFLR